MSSSDWRSNIALGGWVAAGILAALLYSEKVTDGFSYGGNKAQQEDKRSQPQQSISRGNRPPPSTFKRQPPTPEYKADCSKREDADLCAQRRTAVAAEEQGYLSILGLVLLAGTLWFTGRAAFYARQAAIATGQAANAAQTSAATADATLREMQNTARRQLRAYVHVPNLITTERGILWIVVKNAGNTPASNLKCDVSFRWLPGRDQGLPANFVFERMSAPVQWVTTLGAGEDQRIRFAIDAERFDLVRDEKLTLFALITVNYDDEFGEPHYTVLGIKCVRRSDGTFGFDRYGNYSKAN